MMDELRVDMRERTPEEQAIYDRQAQLMFKLNHTMPRTEEYMGVLKELFEDRIGEGSYVAAPLGGAAMEKLVIGKHCFINSNLLAMSRGGITIGDNVQIAGNVQLLSNNHDPYDRQILTCKPIVIKDGAWIGAGATILSGVTIGKFAIVGAASVVTHDVGDYEVVVGSPANWRLRSLKRLRMSKHKMVNGKLLQMNKTYKDLKNRQKDKISGWMYEAYKKQVNEGLSNDEAFALVMDKINEAQIWVPEYEVEQKYNSMKSRFKNRMAAESIPQHIYQMEAILDKAQQKMDALEQQIADFKEYQAKIQELEAYYMSQQWKDDFAMDEDGKFPKRLKKGVLSEDGIYNMLERNKEIMKILDGFDS